MLLLDAEICFYLPNENLQQGINNDLDTSKIIRPSINFCNDMLFSGTVIVDKNIKKIIRGQFYKVLIEMPTIDNQVYDEIHNFLKNGNKFLIQNASRIIGEGQIVNVLFEHK